jgi:hypothetical protein
MAEMKKAVQRIRRSIADGSEVALRAEAPSRDAPWDPAAEPGFCPEGSWGSRQAAVRAEAGYPGEEGDVHDLWSRKQSRRGTR